MGFILALLLCFGVLITVGSVTEVHAAQQEGDIAGGVFYGVDWRITADGELILGDGGDQYFNPGSHKYQTSDIPSGRWDMHNHIPITINDSAHYNYPWYSYRHDITKFSCNGTHL